MPSSLKLKTLAPKVLPSVAITQEQLLDVLGDVAESEKTRCKHWATSVKCGSEGLAGKVWGSPEGQVELPTAIVYSRIGDEAVIHVTFKGATRCDDAASILEKLGVGELRPCGLRKADILQILRGGVFFHEDGKPKTELLGMKPAEFIWLKDTDLKLEASLTPKPPADPVAASSSEAPVNSEGEAPAGGAGDV